MLLILALTFLVVTVFIVTMRYLGFEFIGDQIPHEWKQCEVNIDCTVARENCCGIEHAINRNYYEPFEKKYFMGASCSVIECVSRPWCEDTKCVNGTCAFDCPKYDFFK